MFVELVDILKSRSVFMTIAIIDNDLIRATVTPVPKDKDDKAADLTFTLECPLAEVADLDAQFASQFGEYNRKVQSLEEQLAEINASADEAVKQAKAEAAERVKAASRSTPTKTKVNATTATKPEPPKPAPAPPPPGLFDAPVEVSPAPATAKPAETPSNATSVAETAPESTVKEETAHGNHAITTAA